MRVLWLAPYPLQALTDHLLTRQPLPAGTGMWLLHLSRALAKQEGIELHVLTFTHRIAQDQHFQSHGIQFHVVRYGFPLFGKGPSLFHFNRLTRYRSLLTSIERIIQTVRPDLVHAHGTEEAYSLAALNSGLPSVTSIQGIVHEINRVAPTLEFRLQLPIERVCLEQTRHFGCRTGWDSAVVHRFNPAAHIHYMPEAINPLYFQTPRQPIASPTVTFVGTLVDRKGIVVLLRAMPRIVAEVPDVIFTIIGTGNPAYVRSLHLEAEQQGIAGRITWLGRQEPTAIAAELARSSVYVLPTFMDNSPNSLCEAMAMGLPVISTEVGGVPSLIEPDETGLLVPVDDAARLAEAIVRVLTDAPLARRLAEQARLTAERRNYPTSVAETTVNVYRTIVTN